MWARLHLQHSAQMTMTVSIAMKTAFRLHNVSPTYFWVGIGNLGMLDRLELAGRVRLGLDGLLYCCHFST